MKKSFFIILAIILIVIYVYVCIRSIIKSKSTRYLPKWGWVIICLITIPTGGIIYYFLGKEESWDD